MCVLSTQTPWQPSVYTSYGYDGPVYGLGVGPDNCVYASFTRRVCHPCHSSVSSRRQVCAALVRTVPRTRMAKKQMQMHGNRTGCVWVHGEYTVLGETGHAKGLLPLRLAKTLTSCILTRPGGPRAEAWADHPGDQWITSGNTWTLGQISHTTKTVVLAGHEQESRANVLRGRDRTGAGCREGEGQRPASVSWCDDSTCAPVRWFDTL